VKKLTKFQKRLWDKTNLYKKLHPLITHPACCVFCRYSFCFLPSEQCPRENKRLTIYLNGDNHDKWEVSLFSSKRIAEIDTEVCDKYFQKP